MKSFVFRSSVFIVLALGITACTAPPANQRDPYTSWMRFEGEPGATSFSALDQINKSNVSQLEVAWTYEDPGVGSINPIIVDSTMYVLGRNEVIALHAGTGQARWKHTSEVPGSLRMRGLMYWESPDRKQRRLFFYKGAYFLVAIDATTGQPATEFGEGGFIDLRNDIGTDPNLVTRATSPNPGVIWDDLMILGSAPGEGYIASPGDIRAYNVRTGKLAWVFHTLPRPGEFGYDTWPEGRAEKGGGANAWAGLSVDAERGIVYVPLGSANYDFYGIDRPGENLFANSLVALDARTGNRIWHFQTTHHALWDYDLAATPVLLTVDHEGETVDAVAQATKTGMVFVFNRETGESLWPIEERPVPESMMEGEVTWPTQPFPTRPAPFIPLSFDVETEINPYMAESDRDSLTALLRSMRYEGIYTPPGTEPTLQVPGSRGGANWGSTAGNPTDGSFYVLSFNMPSILHLEPIVMGKTGSGSSPFDMGQGVYRQHCQFCHGASLGGMPNGGIPSLIGVTERLSHDELQEVILNGRAQMPPNPQLSDWQYNALQMYLSNPELALVQEEEVATSEEVPQQKPTRYQSAWRYLLDSNGLPVIRPPWFRLTAYDLNDGTIKWQEPVGEVEHLAQQGIQGTGTSVFISGGPAITAGGLLFLSTDDRLRAYDSDTGEELWSYPLPASGQGIPAVYAVGGRQYVVISTTGARRWGQLPPAPEGRVPQYMAFALPQTSR